MNPDGYFDEKIAATYDEHSAGSFAPKIVEPIVDFISGLADGGRVLELGIGTGRIALPLAARGIEVHGIELSRAMVARLREKPGGTDIPVTIGDFASAKAGGKFSVVYLVANTIENLTTQAEQVACFQNVANHLSPSGCFVIEVGIPDLQRLPPGETARPFRIDSDRLGFDEYDIAEQGLVSHHFRLVDGKWERFSIPFRYVWPAELDLMAQIAQMSLYQRWSGWSGEPFTSESRKLVGVWKKA